MRKEDLKDISERTTEIFFNLEVLSIVTIEESENGPIITPAIAPSCDLWYNCTAQIDGDNYFTHFIIDTKFKTCKGVYWDDKSYSNSWPPTGVGIHESWKYRITLPKRLKIKKEFDRALPKSVLTSFEH